MGSIGNGWRWSCLNWQYVLLCMALIACGPEPRRSSGNGVPYPDGGTVEDGGVTEHIRFSAIDQNEDIVQVEGALRSSMYASENRLRTDPGDHPFWTGAVLLFSYEEACGAIAISCSFPSTEYVTLEFVFGAPQASVGTYPVGDFDGETAAMQKVVEVAASRRGASPAFASAISGSVEVSRVDSSLIAGTYAIGFDTGSSLSGAFEVARCSSLEACLFK